MRIGFDAKRAFYNFTGLGNYSRTLIHNLCEYYKDDEYVLYTPALKTNPMEADLSTFSNLKVKLPQGRVGQGLTPLWRSFFLSQDIRSDGLDIYHGLSHEIPFNAHKTGVKTVVTIHDLIYLRYPELFPLVDRVVYDKKFRYSCDNTQKIIAVSEQTKKDITHFFGIRPEKVEVIYQTCHSRFYSDVGEELKEKVRKKYDLPEEFVLYVGSLIPRKNALSLVKAKKLLEKKLDFPLILIGQGDEYKKQILEYMEINRLNHKVWILENTLMDELPAIYQMASLFVYPSIFEGFGIPIIEALFSQTPVITSQGSCFSEAGGPHSIYIDPYSPEDLAFAIEKVLGDKEQMKLMQNEGHKYVQKFHKRAVTDDLMNLYKRLLEGH